MLSTTQMGSRQQIFFFSFAAEKFSQSTINRFFKGLFVVGVFGEGVGRALIGGGCEDGPDFAGSLSEGGGPDFAGGGFEDGPAFACALTDDLTAIPIRQGRLIQDFNMLH